MAAPRVLAFLALIGASSPPRSTTARVSSELKSFSESSSSSCFRRRGHRLLVSGSARPFKPDFQQRPVRHEAGETLDDPHRRFR